jgi:hypothetical protein
MTKAKRRVKLISDSLNLDEYSNSYGKFNPNPVKHLRDTLNNFLDSLPQDQDITTDVCAYIEYGDDIRFDLVAYRLETEEESLERQAKDKKQNIQYINNLEKTLARLKDEVYGVPKPTED